jgi:microcystin-dependent protein
MAVEPFVGEISIVAFNYAPQGWLVCDGSVLPVNQYQALFALIGGAYGGNGSTTFALPDLRGRLPMGIGQGNGRTLRKFGDFGGVEQTALTVDQLPTHNHPLGAHVHPMPHTHPLAAHNHAMAHTHSLSAHNHPMPHAHDMAAHTHTVTHSHQMNGGTGNEGADPTGRFPGSSGGTKIYSNAGGRVMNAGVISPDSTPSSAPSTANTGAPSATTTADSGAGNTGTPSNSNTADAGSGGTGDPTNANTGSATGTTGTTGIGAKFAIVNPFQCLNFIIAYEGIFPTRP